MDTFIEKVKWKKTDRQKPILLPILSYFLFSDRHGFRRVLMWHSRVTMLNLITRDDRL
jgi:hypothetical protein